VVQSDRMACLRAQTVANVGGPASRLRPLRHPFSFRPDFCEAADPESNGVVEALVGYAKSDLVVPSDAWDDLDHANADAQVWCQEINGRIHNEICAVPAERLVEERRVMRALPSLSHRLYAAKLARSIISRPCVSARYSVPSKLIGERIEVVAGAREVVVYRGDTEVAHHPLVAPGEVSISDDHYGKPAAKPRRAIRRRSNVERTFVSLGDVAEDFLRAAAGHRGLRKPTREHRRLGGAQERDARGQGGRIVKNAT